MSTRGCEATLPLQDLNIIKSIIETEVDFSKVNIFFIFRKLHSAEDSTRALKTSAIDRVLSSEDPCFESSSEVTNMSLYSPQVILQVDNPSSHVYNNVQFYPELVRTVTVPQNVVLTSYEAVIGM